MCLIALAPGTTSPSTAVVRKTLLPQTMGDECPRPSIGIFHLMFFVGLHSCGRFFSSDTPEPSEPLHPGQFVDAAPPLPTTELNKAIPLNITMTGRATVIRRVFFTAYFLC